MQSLGKGRIVCCIVVCRGSSGRGSTRGSGRSHLLESLALETCALSVLHTQQKAQHSSFETQMAAELW